MVITTFRVRGGDQGAAVHLAQNARSVGRQNQEQDRLTLLKSFDTPMLRGQYELFYTVNMSCHSSTQNLVSQPCLLEGRPIP